MKERRAVTRLNLQDCRFCSRYVFSGLLRYRLETLTV